MPPVHAIAKPAAPADLPSPDAGRQSASATVGRSTAAGAIARLQSFTGSGCADDHGPAATHEPATLWLALLEGLGLDPMAAQACTVAHDWLGDQWSCSRPPLSDLQRLYGIEVHELTPWRPMLDHIVDHLAAGRLVVTEADSHWLPHGAGGDYRRRHAKATIAFTQVDRDGRRAVYLHDGGLHVLDGDDFAQVFGLDGLRPPQALDLYADLVALDALVRRTPEDLRRVARRCLADTVANRPVDSPFRRFAADLAASMPAPSDPRRFDAWASVTLHRFASTFARAAQHLHWHLGQPGGESDRAAFTPAIAAFERIAEGGRRLAAGVPNGHPPDDWSGVLDALDRDWHAAMNALEGAFGTMASPAGGASRPDTAVDAVRRLAALPVGAEYPRSPLHREGVSWMSRQCTIDAWIEVLHALGFDPVAAMAFTLRIDFVDDQWTFYKPPYDELRALFGIEVDEITPWRPLTDLTVDGLAQGRLFAFEADTFWLPNTRDTDWYRREHVKTTIVPVAVDPLREHAAYFHNTGLYQLDGEDFRQVFRVDAPACPQALPPLIEMIRLDRQVRQAPGELRRLARRQLAGHVARRPTDNPVTRFAARLASDAAVLTTSGPAHFHAWAFVTVRLLGSAFELAAAHLRWQLAQPGGEPDRDAFEAAAAAFDVVEAGAKTIVMKGARAAFGRKPLQVDATLADMAQAWERGMAALERALRN